MADSITPMIARPLHRKILEDSMESTVDEVPSVRACKDVWIPTCCGICVHGPCLIRVHRVDGKVVGMEGNTQAPSEQQGQGQGRLCAKAFGLIQKLYNPHRIKAPMKRSNPEKGVGKDPGWVEISWDEALDIVAEKLKRVRATDTMRLAVGWGGAQMVGGNNGTWSAFFRAFGKSPILRGGATLRCDVAEHIFGNLIHGTFHCEPDLSYCNYLLVFGRNPVCSGGVPENLHYGDARARGMRMVVIDPVLTPTAAKADEWLPIRPGTDTAFLLSLINTIVHELNVYDAQFLKDRTNSPYLVGPDGYFLRDKMTDKPLAWDSTDNEPKVYDDSSIEDLALEGSYSVQGVEARPVFQVLKDHVKKYKPEWASVITDIDAGTIRRIAKEWVDNARIGSTIKIDNVELPYRPVATKIGRGITGAIHSYQCILANHILAALVGALEVVGGHVGGGKEPAQMIVRGIIPGPDGMLKLDAFPFHWPPVSWAGIETLLPYGIQYGHMSHLVYLNLVHPPENFPVPPGPDVYIKYRCNPLLSTGEPHIVNEALKKIPFIVSIAYVIDETTELADVVLPDNNELERFELTPVATKPSPRRFSGFVLRQPVVEPLHNTTDLSDILTELADRVGFLKEYNEAVNTSFGLIDQFRLDLGKRYSWIEIVDRHCKSVTGGVHDLEWFKREGAALRPLAAEERYEVHLEMTARKLRYPIPYMEHVKKTGEELGHNLAKVGISWWPTFEYVPLPIYVPPILEEVSREYDFYVTIARSLPLAFGTNADIPWIIDIAEHLRGQTEVLMFTGSAAARGIKDGDEVWVESEVGKVKRRVKLSEGIRPDTLLITGQFGHWATPVAKETGWVSETFLTPIRHGWTDHVIGSMQGNVIKAKVYKA